MYGTCILRALWMNEMYEANKKLIGGWCLFIALIFGDAIVIHYLTKTNYKSVVYVILTVTSVILSILIVILFLYMCCWYFDLDDGYDDELKREKHVIRV